MAEPNGRNKTISAIAGIVVAAVVAVLLNFASSPVSESEFVSFHFPPEVRTDAPSAITKTTATLNGTLSDLGDTGSIAVSFQWGLDASLPNETQLKPMIATGTFSIKLENLKPDTTYHYRAKALGNGEAFGKQKTFSTAPVNDIRQGW